MTRESMIEFMKENPNIKITHRLFDSEEYIYQKNGNIYDENNYLFEDWYSDTHCGIRMRNDDAWKDGWYVKIY